MITNNVFQRIFHIRCGDATGTAFAIDHRAKQYLVTARHVFEGLPAGDLIQIVHDKRWISMPTKTVGIGDGKADVAVLSCPIQLAPRNAIEVTSEGMIYGQELYFLGYPFGWDSGMEDVNRDFPMPFVKGGILSAIQLGDPWLIYIDAHGNPGFSGGPVVFSEPGRRPRDFKVAGVVANSPTPVLRPVVELQGEQANDEGDTTAFFAENQGFVVAVDIRHAVDIIDANPIGFSLPPEEGE